MKHSNLLSHHTIGVGLCVMLCSSPALAQQSDQASRDDLESTSSSKPYITLERRQELYDQAKLSHRTAIKRSLLFPGLGSIYADQVFKGMLLMGTSGMSLGLCVGGILRRDRLFALSGGGAFVGLYTFSLITSYRDVDDYNETLRSRYKVQVAPSISPTHQGLVLSMDF